MAGPIHSGMKRFEYMHGKDSGPEWQSFVRDFECWSEANELDDAKKYKWFKFYMGPKAQEIYERLPEPKSDDKRGPLVNITGYRPQRTEYEIAADKLTEHFAPLYHQTYERQVLSQMQQEEGEKIGMFAMRLYAQAERCKFKTELEEHVKDQLIAKCRSAPLLREMLKKEGITYKEVLQMGKVFEAVTEQEKSFNKNSNKAVVEEVHKIESKSNWKKKTVLTAQRELNAKDVVIRATRPTKQNAQQKERIAINVAAAIILVENVSRRNTFVNSTTTRNNRT